MPIAIIVAADEPALFFQSVEEAQLHLEAIDVRDGVYPIAFGRNGEIFDVWEDGEVHVTLNAGPPRPDQLAALLRRYLDAVGTSHQLGEALPDLLAKCELNQL